MSSYPRLSTWDGSALRWNQDGKDHMCLARYSIIWMYGAVLDLVTLIELTKIACFLWLQVFSTPPSLVRIDYGSSPAASSSMILVTINAAFISSSGALNSKLTIALTIYTPFQVLISYSAVIHFLSSCQERLVAPHSNMFRPAGRNSDLHPATQ